MEPQHGSVDTTVASQAAAAAAAAAATSSLEAPTPRPFPDPATAPTPRSPPTKRQKTLAAQTPRFTPNNVSDAASSSPESKNPETPVILLEESSLQQPKLPRRPSPTDSLGSHSQQQHHHSHATTAGQEWQEGEPKTPKPPLSMLERQRQTSVSSSPSDLSQTSARARAREGALSPMTPYVPEVPPAPPSTPASDLRSTIPSSRFFEGLSTPLPYAAVQNAATLERQQQHYLEGAITPAPPKPPAEPKSNDANKTGSMGDDFTEWAVGDRYKMLRMLGRGSYGEVAQALDLYQGRPDAYVAIKRIQSPFDQEVDAVRLFREIHILRRLKGHDCVIDLLDVVQPPTDDLDDFHDLYLVFEYVDTDLYKLIMSPQYLTTEHIQTFLYQMLTGLKFLHSASVIHRDLKPANILLNEDCSLKICDFGLARIVDAETMMSSSTSTSSSSNSTSGSADENGKEPREPPLPGMKRLPLTRQLTKHVVTRWYRAPELILIQPYTSAVDIWSLGCILAELLSMQEGSVPGYQDRTPLFPGGTCYPLSGETGVADERLDQLSVIFGVIGTPSPEDIAAIGTANDYIKTLGTKPAKPLSDLFPAADSSALDLLGKMLHFNPKKRCTAEEALDHDFFQGVRRKEMEKMAGQPLIGPSFLDVHDIDLKTLKQKTFEEVLWYRNLNPKSKKPGDAPPTPSLS